MKFDELDEGDQKALINLARERDSGGLSRRSLLQSGGSLALGVLLGGGALDATGNVSAKSASYNGTIEAKRFKGNSVSVGQQISWPDGTTTTTSPFSLPLNSTFNANGQSISNIESATILDGHGFMGLPFHHINYGSGLSNEEIARVTLDSGDSLQLWRLELTLKGGGTNSNVSMDVYDVTDSTVLGSVTAGSRKIGGSNPIGSTGNGATVIVRMTTGSNPVTVCPTGITDVV